MFSWRRLTYISSARSIIHVQLVQVQLPCLVFYHKLGKQSSRSTAGERWHSSLQWEIESLSHARCAHVPRTYISRNRPTKQTGADAWLAIDTICRFSWSIALYYFNIADINVGSRKRPLRHNTSQYIKSDFLWYRLLLRITTLKLKTYTKNCEKL